MRRWQDDAAVVGCGMLLFFFLVS